MIPSSLMEFHGFFNNVFELRMEISWALNWEFLKCFKRAHIGFLILF